jgi:capsular exopolysaccharide synthesis family protein
MPVPKPPVDPLAALEGKQRSVLELTFDALDRLKRRWWLVVLLALAVPAWVLWRDLQQPTFYRSELNLLLEDRPPRIVDKVTDVVADEIMADTERFAAGRMRFLHSEALSDEVERRLKLPAHALAGRLQAVIDPRSHVITMNVDDLAPAKAEAYVAAFSQAFIDASVADRVGIASDASRFLSGESEQNRLRLEADEKALYDYDRANDIMAETFDESEKIASSKLALYHKGEAEARAEGIKLQAQLQGIAVAKGKNNPELIRLLTLPAAGERWSAPQDRYEQLVEQLHQAETHYGPNHPKLIEVREAVRTVGDALDRSAATAIAAVEARAKQNEYEQQQLRLAIAEETRRSASQRQKELEYNRLKRIVEEDRDAYQLVSKRQRETELQATIKQSFLKRLDGPSAAAEVSRNIAAHGAAALLVGLLLGLVLALIVDLLDDSLKTPAEAERQLEQPLLGIMMHIDTQPDSRDPEVARTEHMVKNPRSLVAEQCHSFTTQIFSQFMDKPPRALMVVSAAVEDGKTLVALHLASTVAARGKRVLLVDGDLRRGRLHRIFQLGRGGGLYDLVTSRVTMDEAIRRTWIPNVDVMTTGEVPLKLSPVRVFEHAEFRRVLDGLKERYDLVVLDTPPVPLVSDALLLGDIVDGAVAVARAKKTSRALTRRLAEQVVGAHINLVGWLLNDLTPKELKSKYYYRYGYGRGYAYHYAAEGEGLES